MTTKDYWGLEQAPPPPDTSGDFYERLRDGTSREILYDHASYPNARVPLNSGTSLPVNPFVGQTFVYQADRANGVYWMFVYLPDETVYPWKYVGGPPLSSEVATSESTASTTYVALATAGPSVTVPLNGDYDVKHGSGVQSPGSGTVAWMSYDIGATGAVDADAVRVFSVPAGSNESACARDKRKTTLAAASALVAKYRTSNVAGTAFYQERWMKVLPVRVKA